MKSLGAGDESATEGLYLVGQGLIEGGSVDADCGDVVY
jgi:hypothetical protein